MSKRSYIFFVALLVLLMILPVSISLSTGVNLPSEFGQGFNISAKETLTGKTIRFPDKNLEESIRQIINKPSGDIYDDEVRNIKRLDINQKNITKLQGIEHLTGLKTLYLMSNKISDIGPVSKLENLEELNLSYNKIADIGGLRNLTKLTDLYLDDNKIKEVYSLGGLHNLESLRMADNQIDDVTPLGGLRKLEHLVLARNNIKDIEALRSLTNLRSLDISDNQICFIEPIYGLRSKNLTSLWADGNDLPANFFREELYENFILSVLSPHISQAISNYYGEGRSYMDAGLLYMNQFGSGYKIKVRVRTFVGAHNPPYGDETIMIVKDHSGIRAKDFTHEDIK